MKFDSFLLLVSLMVSPVVGGYANIGTPFTQTPSSPEHVVITGMDSGLEDFPADAIFEEGDLVDGRREGLWQRYHANGALRSEIHYHDDAPFGDYKVYSDDGLLTEEGRWVVLSASSVLVVGFDSGNQILSAIIRLAVLLYAAEYVVGRVKSFTTVKVFTTLTFLVVAVTGVL